MNNKTIITTMASMAFCTTGAFAADPKLAPDNAWVSVYGEVTSLTPETFDLKYESGEVTVEFDHRYDDENSYKLVVGDKVTVTGMIDDSLFEECTIAVRIDRGDNDTGTRLTCTLPDDRIPA